MTTITRALTSLAVAATSLIPSAVHAQRLSYDYRRQADFTSVKTFAFKNVVREQGLTGKTTTYDSPFVDERTNVAIAAQLERRGMTLNNDNPDIYVITRRTFDKEYTAYSSGWSPYGFAPYGWGPYGWGWPNYGYGYGYGWGGWGSTYIEETIQGTLAIDLEDAGTGELMWRGVGTRHVHETSKPSSRTKRVNEEVSDIFKNFPPPARAAR